MTYEQMSEFLLSSGWVTHWHPENWIDKRWHATITNIDYAGIPTEDAYQRAHAEKTARSRYNDYVNHHPTIHSNRFLSWDELSHSQRDRMIDEINKANVLTFQKVTAMMFSS